MMQTITEPRRMPCSNCTFMELKYGTHSAEGDEGEVLIVPLWN